MSRDLSATICVGSLPSNRRGTRQDTHAKALCPADTGKSPKVIVWVEHHPELGYDLFQQDERDDNERHLQQT